MLQQLQQDILKFKKIQDSRIDDYFAIWSYKLEPRLENIKTKKNKVTSIMIGIWFVCEEKN